MQQDLPCPFPPATPVSAFSSGQMLPGTALARCGHLEFSEDPEGARRREGTEEEGDPGWGVAGVLTKEQKAWLPSWICHCPAVGLGADYFRPQFPCL